MPRLKSVPYVQSLAEKVASVRARAQNFRAIAAATHDSNVKAAMLRLAAEWDKKAESVLAGDAQTAPASESASPR
ncbi:MAG: hypothetical protein AB7I36_07165 [Rhodospirillaceae bacterium]